MVEVFTVSRRYDPRYIPYPENINSPKMFDRNGERIIDKKAHLLEDEKELDAFPKILVDTVLLSEDRAFNEHWGVSIRGFARAALRSLLGNRQGGSTITQQTVKKLFIEPYLRDNFQDSYRWGKWRQIASNLRKKIHQIILAIMLEKHHSKKDILSAYLNRIYLGDEHFSDDVAGKDEDKGSIYGFPEASKIYFSKDITEISVAESAFLVSLLPSPNLPYDDNSCQEYLRSSERQFGSVEQCLDYIKQARDKRIKQLLKEGKITEDDSNKALSTLIKVQLSRKGVLDRKSPLDTAPYFQSFVQDELSDIRKENNLNPYGHYIVETTLDSKSQSDAQARLDKHIITEGKAKRYYDGSIVSLDANDSSILVMVNRVIEDDRNSSYKYSQERMRRLPSTVKYSQERMNRRLASTFKLFIYAAALEDRVIPVEDGSSKSLNEVKDGFAKSSNEEALSIASQVRKKRVIDLAEKSRIRGAYKNSDYKTLKQQYQEAEDKSKFIVLGLVESNLLDITNSFAMIANEGKLNHPYSIVRVRDPNKCDDSKDWQTCEVIYSREKTMGEASESLLKPKTTEGVWQLLQSVVQYGTAKESVTIDFSLFDVGGKTGTSTDNRDLWFIGTARSQRILNEDIRISTGVWLGVCAVVQNSSPYSEPECNSNGSSSDAVKLWNDYMNSTLKRSLKSMD
jgi:membrane peptidoglycan carboxypeptidase